MDDAILTHLSQTSRDRAVLALTALGYPTADDDARDTPALTRAMIDAMVQRFTTRDATEC